MSARQPNDPGSEVPSGPADTIQGTIGVEETVAATGDAMSTEQTVAAGGDGLPTEDLARSERPTVRRGQGAQSRARALQRGDALGRYLVLELLGAGGMGEVYAAYDPELDRKIALKVLRPTLVGGVEVSEARSRLLREAQAMARLSHPNVIAVYDVGTVGDNVYVAMEFVEGPDVRGWLREEKRPWPEVLELFLAAARGLAAAHEARLVHRDFKPDNVLVGRDGRVRVIDFGLARRARADDADAGHSRERIGRPRVGADNTTVTETGAVMGTPAYMAPEQFDGRPADARTDQFNFSVALYEALFGERPFAGDSFTALAVAVTSGERRPVPEQTDVPEWIMTAVERGLSIDPEARFESMEEMAGALTPPERRRRWPWVAAAAAAVLLAGGAMSAAAFGRDHVEPCRGMDAPLAGVWDAGRKREVRAAFEATKLPYADEVWQRVEKTLDDYAGDWAGARVDACRATAVRKEQSEEMRSRRMACLDRRLHELDAVVTVMASADQDVVDNAAQAAAGLAPVRDCENEALLLASNPSALGADDPRIAALDRRLARVKALEAAGKYEPGKKLAVEALKSAREQKVRSREARALYWRGVFEQRLGDADKALETLFAAVRIADLAGAPTTEAKAWTRIVGVTSAGLDRYKEAERWAKHAKLAIEQAGNDIALEGELHHALGGVYFKERRYPEALTEFKSASALYTRAYGPDDWRVAGTKGMQGSTLRRLNRHEEAAEMHRAALSAMEKALGPAHPKLAPMLNNLGISLTHVGELEEAREVYQRAVDLKTRTLGPDHPSLANTIFNLGLLEERLGHFDRAIEQVQRTIAIRIKALGEDHPAIARARSGLARIKRKQKKLQEAAEIEEDVLSRYEGHYGADGVATANIRAAYCDVLTRLGKLGEAARQCARAVKALEHGPDRRNLAWALTYEGLVDVAAGRASRAVDELERAHAIREEVPGEPKYTAETDAALALALHTAGRDADRAVELARGARETMQSLPPGDREFLPIAEKLLP